MDKLKGQSWHHCWTTHHRGNGAVCQAVFTSITVSNTSKWTRIKCPYLELSSPTTIATVSPACKQSCYRDMIFVVALWLTVLEFSFVTGGQQLSVQFDCLMSSLWRKCSNKLFTSEASHCYGVDVPPSLPPPLSPQFATQLWHSWDWPISSFPTISPHSANISMQCSADVLGKLQNDHSRRCHG